MQSEIAWIVRAVRENGPGSLIAMKDGSRWFHPYSGAAPVKEHARA